MSSKTTNFLFNLTILFNVVGLLSWMTLLMIGMFIYGNGLNFIPFILGYQLIGCSLFFYLYCMAI